MSANSDHPFNGTRSIYFNSVFFFLFFKKSGKNRQSIVARTLTVAIQRQYLGMAALGEARRVRCVVNEC
ncbi:MAG: hypothetical protein AAGJ37_03270 [Pseudomonadota bacterium]